MFPTAALAMDVVSHIPLDANNNNNENLDLNLQRNEKYSLRQRYKRAVAVNQTPSPDPYDSANNGSPASSTHTPTTGAGKQRSRAPAQPRPPKKGKPFLSVEDLHTPPFGSPLSPSSCSVTSSSSRSSYDTKPAKEKPKSKAPPLSKYRRKTANARERTRMREINSAFETLRKCVPMSVCLTNNASHFDPLFLTTHQAPGSQVQVTTPGNEKLTKITTLKVAMKYIRMLTEVLNGSMPMGGSTSETTSGSSNSSHKTSLLSIKVPPTQSPKKTAQRNSNLLMTTTTPRGGCKQAAVRVKTVTQNPAICPQVPSHQQESPVVQQHTPSYNPFLVSGVDMLFGSPCLTPPIDECSSASDLAMLIESAQEEDALRLGESCLSPPLSEQNIKVSFNTLIPEESATDLELGFLLESDSDTLQLSEPCLSPLSSALDPFSDLLTSGFNEQTVLDMYL